MSELCRGVIRVCCVAWLASLGSSKIAFAQGVQGTCPSLFRDLRKSAECLENAFSQTDIPFGLPHLTLSSIAPGNGFPIGVVWERRKHMVNSPFDDLLDASGQPVSGQKSLVDFTAALVGSTNGSWYGTGSVVWLPPIGSLTAKQNVGVQFYVTHRVYNTIGFFGLGPETSSVDLVTYKQTDTFGGATLRVPMTDWFAVTGQVENRKPEIVFSAPSYGSTPITEANAPGVQSQPDFMHYSAGITLRAQTISEAATDDPDVTPPGMAEPPLMKRKIVLTVADSVTEHWYEDLHHGAYSFRQFAFAGDEALKFHTVIRRFVPPASMTTSLRLLRRRCNSRTSGLKVHDECDFGELHVRPLIVLSNAGSGTTPFYLQPTLGGSDIESRPTLLAFENYRFRAPDAAMIGVDYQVPVFYPIGVLVFYDVGSVGSATGGFSESHLRQDAGLGATLQIARNVVARGYIGFGGTPGAHFGYNFTKFF
jgi:hypothetical protein